MHLQARQVGDYLIAWWVLLRVEQRGIVAAQLLGNGDDEGGKGAPLGGGDIHVGLLYHVEDYVIVGLVAVVVVTIPVTCLRVDFYVAHPQHAVNLQLGVEEVRTAARTVVQSGVDDLHKPPVGGVKVAERQYLMSPCVV